MGGLGAKGESGLCSDFASSPVRCKVDSGRFHATPDLVTYANETCTHPTSSRLDATPGPAARWTPLVSACAACAPPRPGRPLEIKCEIRAETGTNMRTP